MSVYRANETYDRANSAPSEALHVCVHMHMYVLYFISFYIYTPTYVLYICEYV